MAAKLHENYAENGKHEGRRTLCCLTQERGLDLDVEAVLPKSAILILSSQRGPPSILAHSGDWMYESYKTG